jgi:hypothetical protein
MTVTVCRLCNNLKALQGTRYGNGQKFCNVRRKNVDASDLNVPKEHLCFEPIQVISDNEAKAN